MSPNLDLVKSIYVDWERGDWSSVEWADPEIEFEMVGGLVEGRWKGLRKMSEAWSVMLSAWDDLRAKADEFFDLDDGRVLVLLRNEGRGRGSGIEIGEISTKAANLFTIRDRKVTRLVLYWDRDQATADAGLSESIRRSSP
jgi:ketosteroid isomerase-like protein